MNATMVEAAVEEEVVMQLSRRKWVVAPHALTRVVAPHALTRESLIAAWRQDLTQGIAASDAAVQSSGIP